MPNPNTPPSALASLDWQSGWGTHTGTFTANFAQGLQATTKTPRKAKKNANRLYNVPLIEAFSHLLSKKKADGEVGLEIECEGTSLFDSPISYWKAGTDGSLRATGDHPPVEYVLRRPLDRADVPKALTYLTRKLKEVGSKVTDSTRTSVHVHVNCQSLTMKQVIQYWCLYVVFEELLVNFSGPDREGNLFCLRAKDAEHAIAVMEQGLKTDQYQEIFSEHLRYTSCNTASLSKFGSLEFRSMRGTVDQGLIQLWVDILLLLRDKALEYDNPQKIVRDFEAQGPQAFMYKIFSSRPDIYETFVDYPYRNQQMWDGLRLMRDVAYAVKWEKAFIVEKKDLEEKEDPLEPRYIRDGVYLQWSQQYDRWYVCNWNTSSKTGRIGEHGFSLMALRGRYIDPDTGLYQNRDTADVVELPFGDLENPDGVIFDAPEVFFDPEYYDGSPDPEPDHEPEGDDSDE